MSNVQTLEEARQFLRDNWEKGCECDVCGQRVQLYNYKLFSTSAYALILLHNLDKKYSTEKYFHISKYAEAKEGKARAPHFAELRFWGLVEKCPINNDSAKKSSGNWAITEKGKQFVNKEIRVQSRILIFNNKFQGFAENSELIDINDALENKFDYAELMGYK